LLLWALHNQAPLEGIHSMASSLTCACKQPRNHYAQRKRTQAAAPAAGAVAAAGGAAGPSVRRTRCNGHATVPMRSSAASAQRKRQQQSKQGEGAWAWVSVCSGRLASREISGVRTPTGSHLHRCGLRVSVPGAALKLLWRPVPPPPAGLAHRAKFSPGMHRACTHTQDFSWPALSLGSSRPSNAFN
jgi:hypothetical protein